jgi:hypothetical protein
MLRDADHRGWPEQSRKRKDYTTSEDKSANGSLSDSKKPKWKRQVGQPTESHHDSGVGQHA